MALSTLKNSQGIVLIFDVTNRQSFNDLKKWLDDVNNVTNKICIILFGNKCESDDRVVTEEEAMQFANENNILYIEASAKENINIGKGFSQVINDAYEKYGVSGGLALRKKGKNKKC